MHSPSDVISRILKTATLGLSTRGISLQPLRCRRRCHRRSTFKGHTIKCATRWSGGALTHEARFDELNREEPEDPRFWAVHGARLVGYEKKDLIWRYSLPSDIETICNALGEMTEADMRANVERALEEDCQYEGTTDRQHGEQAEQRFMREALPKRLLPSLRQFYEAAREEKQIVIRWMG